MTGRRKQTDDPPIRTYRAQIGNRTVAIPAQGQAASDATIKILIVDDEPKNLIVLGKRAGRSSLPARAPPHRRRALLALMKEEFALLILDVKMPDMTGLEFAQMVKQRKQTEQIPIIFLTAYYSEDQHVLDGYSTGAVDYLHKPVNAPVLRSQGRDLRQHLSPGAGRWNA